MRSVGQSIVESALRRGMILLVDTKQCIRYFPSERMTQAFKALVDRHHYKIREWLIADAVSGGDDDDHRVPEVPVCR